MGLYKECFEMPKSDWLPKSFRYFGACIEALRRARCMTPEEVARAMHANPKFVRWIERGYIVPDTEGAQALGWALRPPTRDLLVEALLILIEREMFRWLPPPPPPPRGPKPPTPPRAAGQRMPVPPVPLQCARPYVIWEFSKAS